MIAEGVQQMNKEESELKPTNPSSRRHKSTKRGGPVLSHRVLCGAYRHDEET